MLFHVYILPLQYRFVMYARPKLGHHYACRLYAPKGASPAPGTMLTTQFTQLHWDKMAAILADDVFK